MARKRRRVIFISCVAIVFISVFYYVGCIHRVHETVEKDGWILAWNYMPFRCPHCWGRIERLEFDGQHIACPDMASRKGESTTRFGIYTPVGMLECYHPEMQWRVRMNDDRRPTNECGDIAEDELLRGYYELTDARPPCKKTGTPPGWSYATSSNHIRWVDPKRIQELPW